MFDTSRTAKLHGLLLIVLLLLTGPMVSARGDELEDGFKSPPDVAKPHTWWHWVSGNVSKEGITADLEAMKRIGLGGLQCFSADQVPNPRDRGKILYMSPEWRELTKHAISEANRLGLTLAIHDCEGWSESGGPWISVAQSMQKVVWTSQQATGPAQFHDKLRQPERFKDFYHDIAVFAYPSLPDEREDQSPAPTTRRATTASTAPAPRWRVPEYIAKSGMSATVFPDTPPTTQVSTELVISPQKLIELTPKLGADGTLTWDVPEGKWTILRMGHTSTGKENAPAMSQTRGLECDKLDRDAVKAQFAGMLGKVIEDSKPLIGKGLQFVLMDSWEARCQNWTPKFREEFQKRRGYDPMPWLAAMTGRYVDSAEKTERFLWDVRRTIADLIAENHYGLFQQLCHDNNLKLTAEAVGIGMPTIADELQCKSFTDVPMGEFWVNRHDGNGDVRETASAAHLYAKTLAAAEAFTARTEDAAWRNDPYSLKAQGDEMFCMGINRFVFHRYAHQPWLDRTPGMTMGPWGTNFERTNTWWEPARAWMSYITRCQFLLQRGLFVADFVYYYGEGAPRNLTPLTLTPKPPAGYDYDGCGTDALLTRMTVKDGRIVLPDGMSYRVLVLPNEKAMSPAVAKKVKQLVNDGATVYGPKPTQSPSLSEYPKCDDEVKSIASELWGDADTANGEHTIGKGRIVWGKPIEETLAVSPDFQTTGKLIRYIHRRDGDADIYFVSNGKAADTIECTFRVGDKAPELWDPNTGTMQPAVAYTVKDGRTTIPLRFDASGSVFVIFRKPAATGSNSIVLISRGGKQLIPPIENEPSPVGKLEIRKAVYGPPAFPQRQIDITDRLAGRIKNGFVKEKADNDLAGRDPARQERKVLKVDYAIDGKPATITLEENVEFQLPESAAGAAPAVEMIATSDGKPGLLAWESGKYEVRTTASDQPKSLEVTVPQAAEVPGGWKLSFPPKLGAPDSVQLDKLISWSDHGDDGVKFFSGTATYTKTIDVPADLLGENKPLYLDLGDVKNLAEVSLNGKDLGILWKSPFRMNVTSAAKAGSNELTVKVTNLWPNRLIGDAGLPPEKRVTWTAFEHYKKSDPLLPSGLLGPVKLVPAVVAPVQKD